jgi:dephospho-CoA kinase
LFLYNAALIAEAGTTSKLNNNIVLVNVSPEIQAKRLFQRLEKNGFSPENISQIVSSQISNQFTTEQKRDTLANEIKKNKHGEIIELQSPYDEQDLEIAFNKILAQIDTFGELRFAGLLNRV